MHTFFFLVVLHCPLQEIWVAISTLPTPIDMCNIFECPNNGVCCMCWGFVTCAHMLMHAIACRGCTDTARESALKVDSGRKIPCRTGDSNPRLTFQSDTLPTELFPAHLGCVKSTIHYAWLYCVKVCCLLLSLVVLCEVLL